MSNLINKILVEWSYRLDDGIIDLENYKHLSILREVLSDMELSSEVIIEVMSNITEKEKEWFYAIKKDTKKTSRFGSKKTRDAAIKAGTHTAVGKKDDKVKGQDLFKTDTPPETESDDLRDTDHESTDNALTYTKSQAKEDKKKKGKKGVGAGTAESRAGEAATHKALRMLKEGKSYEEIEEYLMSIAKNKDTFLTEEWVRGALNCAKYLEKKYGLDNIDEIVWDTPSGRKLIDVEGHGTSADMFIKTKDGRKIGISLKKSGKVFILNGGFNTQFEDLKQRLRDSGLSEEKIKKLEEITGINTYNKDRQEQFNEGINQLLQNRKLYDTEVEYFLNNPDIASNKSNFGPSAEKYLKILKDSPGLDALAQKSVEGTLTGDEMKALSKLAKASKKIREQFPEIYDEMRNAEIRLTQRILQAASEDKEIEEGLKEVVIKGIHIESILGLDENEKIDEFITLYGSGGGTELNKDKIVKMFGSEIGELTEKFKQAKTKEEKQKIKKEILSKIKEKIYIDKKDGARDGIVKIKHEDGKEYPLFTIKTRTKPIGTAPSLEMQQTNFMSNALDYGFDTNEWPDTQFNNFIKKQIKELQDDWDGEPPTNVVEQIKELESQLR